MPQNACPACRAPLTPADMNIEQGVALCPGCGKLSRLADIADQGPPPDPSLAADPPPGCRWYQDGVTTIIVASARSVGGAIFPLVFAAFWNGIVSIFVLIAAAGLYTNLVGPLPSWFPAPPVNAPQQGGAQSGGSSAMPLGITLFLCIFLIPFVLIGIGSLLMALACLVGRVEVRLRGDEGEVRNAIGPLKWTRRFNASMVSRVGRGETSYTQNNRTKPLIQIEAGRTIKFGSTLSERRREWMLAALHALLVPGPTTGRRAAPQALSHR